MTLPYSTSLVQELQYWFNRVILERNLNKDKIPHPVLIPQIYLKPKSFVELLFNESYPYTSYEYFYQDLASKSGWPALVRDRIAIYPSSKVYEICDSTAAFNLFQLKPHDITLLNALLAYRVDSTSVTLIDSTSVVLVDSTSTNQVTLYASLGALNTDLSKLIYLYLKLKVDGDTSLYDTTTLISKSYEVLESCYEAFLIEQYFDFIAARGT